MADGDGIRQATGGPLTLNFDGQSYRLRALTPADLAELLDWMADQPFVEAGRKLKALEEIVTPEERVAILSKAEDQATAIRSDTRGAFQVLADLGDNIDPKGLRGLIYMTWLMLRRDQPGLDLRSVGDIVTPATVTDIMKAITATNALWGKVKAGPTTKRPRQPRRRTGGR